MKAQIEAQKKFAEMVVAIADSHFEHNDYEIYQVHSLKKLSESKIVFNYMSEIDHTLELIIGLDENLETYKVFGADDLLFASKDVEVVIEFLNQQVDEFEAEIIRNRVC
ncbi:hypothetical protein DHX103_02570 [Planococcus sp. X10-3]|uniref:hypothetical protein n=1 Tax=Planococcus sp. X10-3 TaxID=3061240 RepID=UPI003BAE8638